MLNLFVCLIIWTSYRTKYFTLHDKPGFSQFRMLHHYTHDNGLYLTRWIDLWLAWNLMENLCSVLAYLKLKLMVGDWGGEIKPNKTFLQVVVCSCKYNNIMNFLLTVWHIKWICIQVEMKPINQICDKNETLSIFTSLHSLHDGYDCLINIILGSVWWKTKRLIWHWLEKIIIIYHGTIIIIH